MLRQCILISGSLTSAVHTVNCKVAQDDLYNHLYHTSSMSRIVIYVMDHLYHESSILKSIYVMNHIERPCTNRKCASSHRHAVIA